MPHPDDAPLIYTSRGNLPADSLQYRHHWTDNATETTLVEEHWLDGEIVKRSVHTMLKHGTVMCPVLASFG